MSQKIHQLQIVKDLYHVTDGSNLFFSIKLSRQYKKHKKVVKFYTWLLLYSLQYLGQKLVK